MNVRWNQMWENLWLPMLGPLNMLIQSEMALDWIGAFKGPNVGSQRFSCVRLHSWTNACSQVRKPLAPRVTPVGYLPPILLKLFAYIHVSANNLFISVLLNWGQFQIKFSPSGDSTVYMPFTDQRGCGTACKTTQLKVWWKFQNSLSTIDNWMLQVFGSQVFLSSVIRMFDF